jgi:hypothetical protein
MEGERTGEKRRSNEGNEQLESTFSEVDNKK